MRDAHARPIESPVTARSITHCIGILFVSLSACTQERIVRANQPLAGLPGATGGFGVPADRRFNFPDPAAAPEGGIRQEAADGAITLYARSGRQLMAHIYTTLQNNERGLFAEQVLSSVTRAEFVSRGKDPAEAFDLLKKDERHVLKLFDQMPQGEHTPGVVWQKLGTIDGKNLVRLGVSGLAARDLRYTHFDMVMERGNWRLRWFGR